MGSVCCCVCCKSSKKEPLIDATEADIHRNFEGEDNLIGERKISGEEKNEEEENKRYPEELSPFIDPAISNEPVFKEEWYNQYEKGKIVYSKQTIVALLKYSYSPDAKGFKEFHKKDQLSLYIKDSGSFLNDKFQLMRSEWVISKGEVPSKTTVLTVAKYFIHCKERKKWDTQLKAYETVEGSELGVSLLHNWMKAPAFFLSENDIIDKRYDFILDENGKEVKENDVYNFPCPLHYFSFESSVPSEVFPEVEKVKRIEDIMSVNWISEDKENFYVKCMSQVDIKSPLPASSLNGLIPNKLKNFYTSGIKEMKKDEEEINNI